MARFLLTHAVTAGAERSPERDAVRFSGKSLSYAELEARTNSLACLLIEQGVTRGDRVGIFMNKGLESAVAIYGIMKAGAAYVPLDPFAPVARVAFVIQDCGIRHLLTKEAKAGQVQEILELHRGSGASPLECLIGLAEMEGYPVRCIPWEQAFTVSSMASA